MLKENLYINPILKNVKKLFSLSALLKEEIVDENVLQNYRERIHQFFSDFEKQAIASNWDNNTVTNTKYALTAYIDETVSTSKWTGRIAWMNHPLQLEFFGEHIAGEGFFEHLQKLREFSTQTIDLLELYYVCIQLGFKGKYRLRNTEQLLGLQADLRSQIEAIRGITTNQLSPDITIKETVTNKFNCSISTLILAMIIILLILYLGFSIAISEKSHESIAKIEAIQSTMMFNKN